MLRQDRPPLLSKRTAHHAPPSKRLASSAPLPPQEGDPHWLRVMQTKENQWRFMNTIALHEMNILERRACDQLENLSSRLDSVTASTAHTEALVASCRALRANQIFHSLAAPVLRGLAGALRDITPHYNSACRMVLDAARTLHLRGATLSSQTALQVQLQQFRAVATRFQHASRNTALPDMLLVCDALDQLAALVVAEEARAVSCAAEAVAEAAKASEFERSVLAEKVTRIRAKKMSRSKPRIVKPN